MKILEEKATEMVYSIDQICILEAQSPSTMNTEGFESWRIFFATYIPELHQLRSGRTPRTPQLPALPNSHTLCDPFQWLVPFSNHGLSAINQERVRTLNANNLALKPVGAGGENFTDEIMVMSNVLAYFCISVGRFVDNMSSSIGRQFLDNFCAELERKLAVKLGLDGSKGYALCLRYAMDRPQDKHARKLCLERIEFLEAAIARIEGLCPVTAILQ